ncbi:MAG: pantetheine-phosphate adenylyltransferase [Bdellovibrionaceae bacterium]|nr:pantetheine-phosphate adenylyltransferase [Pseudobdellovibrionaceae bacterium]
MSKVAVYPGSFDPITTGHLDIIERIANIFDHVIVLVAESDQKNYLFTAQERAAFLKEATKTNSKIEIDIFSGLTVEYMKKRKANVIVRGLRAVADFEYEGTLASMNKRLAPHIETFMIFSRPEYYFISSRGVKEVAGNQGDLKGLVPDFIIPELTKKLTRG